MKTTCRLQRPSSRVVTLCSLVTVLALLPALSTVGGLVLGAAGLSVTGESTIEGKAVQPAISHDQSAIPGAQSTPRTIAYTYDAAGRLVQADYGDRQVIAYTYDAAGNLLRREVYQVATPTLTPTATPTNTPTPTSTPTVTPTPTWAVKLYLPLVLKGYGGP